MRLLFVGLVMVVTVVVIGIGFMTYRQYVNEQRCETALGTGAGWRGGDECFPPPVTVGGLM